MARLYPLLYVLENSVREFIDRLMTSLYGDDWWNGRPMTSSKMKKLRRDVSDRMKKENKNSWHQKRGARPIDYLDFIDLRKLLRRIESDVVPKYFPCFEWLSQLMEEVYQSRCVICHMNPLSRDNAQALKLKFRQWQRQIGTRVGTLPQRVP
ncbi:hypothetical protein CH330_03840 [candidate division WOR-3 bacterium JGI_Cruoil_03_51_56]|uniref:Swt1-like HEPN domain-containing protein n=1 Tax=candidate division WOR-3 bacterium JGI_Cruoil_03_51_56 TaxID=1973747 RepID=A0A235BW76_UNCW3|nr:MAG: hypothetical protein CH330_03840 [candidate division WOR-3 bacterium JGI_Cruoil_03_51_56]